MSTETNGDAQQSTEKESSSPVNTSDSGPTPTFDGTMKTEPGVANIPGSLLHPALMNPQVTAFMQQQQNLQQSLLGVQTGSGINKKTPSSSQSSANQAGSAGMSQLLQQQLMLQIQQSRYLAGLQGSLPGLSAAYMGLQGLQSGTELHDMWKHLATGTQNGIEDNHKMNGLTNLSGLYGIDPSLYSLMPAMMPSLKLEPNFMAHPLFKHGVCKWPSCDQPCDDYPSFIKHLNGEHQLDDRNTAQVRVQMQVVANMEENLRKESERLHAMMQHLRMMNPLESGQLETNNNKTTTADKNGSTSSKPMQSSLSGNIIPNRQTPVSSRSPKSPPLHSITSNPSPTPGPTSRSHRRSSESSSVKSVVPSEIDKNRRFYRDTDVRPPFTYASLIRQAINESPSKQLTLNEVYTWFQDNFSYFRRNEATWKNAVRHNLSLHKCFMRVENVKGAVWTVDEMEFHKRRPQKSLNSNTPSTLRNRISSSSSTCNSLGDSFNSSQQRPVLDPQLSIVSNPDLSMDMDDEQIQDLSLRNSQSENDLGELRNSTIQSGSEISPSMQSVIQSPMKHHYMRYSPSESRTEIKNEPIYERQPSYAGSPNNEERTSNIDVDIKPSLLPPQNGMETHPNFNWGSSSDDRENENWNNKPPMHSNVIRANPSIEKNDRDRLKQWQTEFTASGHSPAGQTEADRMVTE